MNAPDTDRQPNRRIRRNHQRPFGRVIGMLCLIALACALSISKSAHAAFPGANGKIAFTRSVSGNEDIYVMNPDGSNVVQLTSNAATDQYPRWCADGSKIVLTVTAMEILKFTV